MSGVEALPITSSQLLETSAVDDLSGNEEGLS
jgi:hypothetical protein